MSTGRDSILVLREAILKLEQSTQINKIFHPARVEAVNAIIDTIVHVGRTMIPDQQRKLDSDTLYESAAQHLAAAIKLEQLAEDNTSIEQSVKRLKQSAPEMPSQIWSVLILVFSLQRSIQWMQIVFWSLFTCSTELQK